MALDAQQVQDLQNSAPPTDWAKFDQGINPTDYGRGVYEKDSVLHVRFFMLSRIDVEESTRENRPIYRDIPYVEVMIPADKNNIVVEPVWDQYKQRFPQQWEQFMRGEQQQAVGTPLKAAPFLNPARVAELNYLKIFTVEQLANLPDSVGFMGSQTLKQSAQRFLEKTGSNEALMERIRKLEEALADKSLVNYDAPVAMAGEDKPKKNFGR